MIASPSIEVDKELLAEFGTFAAIRKPQEALEGSLMHRLVTQAITAAGMRDELSERTQDLRSLMADSESRRQAAQRADDFAVIAHHTSELGAIREALDRTEADLAKAIKAAEESARQRDAAWVLMQNALAALTQFLTIGDSGELRAERRADYAWRTLRGLLTPNAPNDGYVRQALGLGR